MRPRTDPSREGQLWRLAAVVSVALGLAAGPAGPAAAGVNRWTSHGPEGGPVRVLAVDPGTPTTLYAGTNGSGVFKSTNGGGSWSAVNTGLTDPTVSTLAVDPGTPATLDAGTDGGGRYERPQG